MERYFYSKDGPDVQGPIALDDLQQMRVERILTSETQVCMEGTETRQPIEIVAPTPPATPKQIAYLTYMGVADADRMKKDEVSIALAKLLETPDIKLWQQLRQKQEDWATDRFILYPDLYAQDIDYMLHQELPRTFHAFVRSRIVGASETLTKAKIRQVIDALSQENRQWWQAKNKRDVFFTKLCAMFPSCVNGRPPESPQQASPQV
jgi:GYF domain 2